MTKLEVSSSFKLLGVTIDDKLTLEKHICNIASSIGQKSGLIRKCYKTFGNNEAVLNPYAHSFYLPLSTVWCSAHDSHLKQSVLSILIKIQTTSLNWL